MKPIIVDPTQCRIVGHPTLSLGHEPNCDCRVCEELRFGPGAATDRPTGGSGNKQPNQTTKPAGRSNGS